MGDMYAEVLVKRQMGIKEMAARAAVIAAAAAALVVGFLWYMPALLAALVLAAAGYFVFQRTNLEYEYLFVNGELDIDVIMNRSRRKRVASYQMKDMELMAPLGSERTAHYEKNTGMRVRDFSSGNGEARRYLMVAREGEQGASKVILEPGEELAEYMKKSSPARVFLD